MKTHFKLSAVFLVALNMAACSNTSDDKQTAPTLSISELAEERIAAIERTRVQEADYFKSLATAVSGEMRNEAWAMEKESELRESYAAEKGVPRGALENVECRSSKCALELQVSSKQPPESAIEQQRVAIDHWIAWSQPCSYAATTEMESEQESRTIRIFLDCSE